MTQPTENTTDKNDTSVDPAKRRLGRVALNCLCGASWKWSGPLTAVESASLRGAWDMKHSGDGHGPATPRQAGAARRRQEGNPDG